MDAEGRLTAIVEQADANEAQQKIDVINTGFYIIEKSFLDFALPLLDCDNAQNEVYLTDIVSLGHRHHRNIGAMMGSDPDEMLGVNSQAELHMAEKLMIMRGCKPACER
jgi:bifunctional N-acetylglucosamine-1-phosphate-uridyltransferase/glucosamine-1-phosphate-acetyltransferase GlmU-like protein